MVTFSVSRTRLGPKSPGGGDTKLFDALRKLCQIKEATGMTNVSDMVNHFLQAEEKNFSLFNFVNDLNRYRSKEHNVFCLVLTRSRNPASTNCVEPMRQPVTGPRYVASRYTARYSAFYHAAASRESYL